MANLTLSTNPPDAGDALTEQDKADIRTSISAAEATATAAAIAARETPAGAQAKADAARDAAIASAATDARLSDAREWTAATVDQAEAETGTATTRRAWTAQRVAQAIAAQVAAWWTSISTAAGRALVTAADAAAQRSALGLGTAATTAASAYATAAQAVPAGGTTGQVLAKTSATDYATAWTTPSGGGGTPGGSSGQLQYNNAGAFGGDAGLSYDATTDVLQFGGTSASHVGLRGAGAWLEVRTASNSAFGYLQGAILSAGTSSYETWMSSSGLAIGTSCRLGFSSSANGYGSPDCAIQRSAAGVVEVNNGTAGTFRDMKMRRLIASEGMQLTAATVGTLPAAASNTYLSAVVTDASGPTVGATVASGGSAKAVVRSNGTNYIVTEVL